MKSTVAIAVASLFTVIAPAAHAAYDRYGNYYDPGYRAYDYRGDTRADYARVIESRPVYADNREVCWNKRDARYEPRPDRDNRVGAGTAIGAVAGGVIGHQVGSGRGNDVATIGGALLGGLIGHNVEKNRNDDHPDFDFNDCRTMAGRDLQGYDVRYVYNGQEYTTRMSADPGRRLLVGRDIRDDGTPFQYATESASACNADAFNRPSWCDQDGQGG